ncbi:MAG: pitrilysin family protein [Acidimicrobiales bacterium]|nr:pitrilysin family protein [Acidimicrobiales bacterium]
MTTPDIERETRVSRLPGGLRLATQHDPTARSVAVGVWVGVGNRDETPEIAGASHFLEHLLFKGSTSRSARDIAEGIDAVGGDLNAFTSKEYTAFHARTPAKDLDFGLDTLLDVVADPGFTAADVDAERQVILEELAWSADTPDDVVHQNLALGLFPDHSLGWEVLGSAESVAAITADDIRSFHERWYRRANLVVAVVGDVDHDEICARVDARLGGLADGEAPVRIAPTQPVVPETIVRRDIEQSHVTLGWRAVDQFDDDRFALAVANQLIGGGWSSRLFQEVREKRGISYSVFSSMGSYVDSGTFSIYAGTHPARVPELADVVERELADLVENGPSEREMEVASGGFEGGTVLAMEDAGSRMTQIATNLLVRDRVVLVPEYLEKVRAVSADDVQRVLTKVVRGPQVRSIVEPR